MHRASYARPGPRGPNRRLVHGDTVCHSKQDQAPAGFRTLLRPSVLGLQTRLTRQGGDKAGVKLLDQVALGIGQGALLLPGLAIELPSPLL